MKSDALKNNVSRAMILLGFAFLIIISAMLLIPILWSVIASLKDPVDYVNNTFSIPDKWNFQNYSSIFNKLKVDVFIPEKGTYTYGFITLFTNSLLIALVFPVMPTLSTAFTAYIISKYKCKFTNFLQVVNIIVMIIPIVGSLPSALIINKMIGRYDNFLLMALLGCSPFGFNLLFFKYAFERIDNAYREAAYIDGAGDYSVLFRIMLPMMMPAMGVIYLLGFLGAWNDYMTPLVWLRSFPNLALGMYFFQYSAAKYGASIPEILAGFVIVSIPSVILFLSLQGKVMKNLSVGGIKG